MLLKRCLDSLLSLPSDIDYEVILVDDGTPETSVPAWLSEWQVPSCVRYFYQENKGLGGARNNRRKADGATSPLTRAKSTGRSWKRNGV